MAEVFFTADTHYGHAKVLEYCPSRPYHSFRDRPYETVEEMNEDMVNNWNTQVGPKDIVYHLGDVGMGHPRDFQPYIQRLNGIRKLIKGNHDATTTKLLEAGFHTVSEQDYIVHQPSKKVLWLAHIPINNKSDRRGYQRPSPWGPFDIALCGHVHTKWLVGPAGEINVGVDQWYMAPVHIDEIIDLAESTQYQELLKAHPE